jgi:four helix bundle protein
MRDFRKLKIWQRSHQLTLEVYKHTKNFPKTERYGLASQIRRSAASVPANIAEGCGRSEGDFSRFLQIAMGSASELEYHLMLASDLDHIRKEEADQLIGELQQIKRMIVTYMKKVRKSN